MYYWEELVSAAIALALGIVLVVAPAKVYRLQFFAHGPDTGRGGSYGEGGDPPARILRIVQILGVVLIGVAIAFLSLPLWR